MQYYYRHVKIWHSIECYLPYFYFSYCETNNLAEHIIWKRYKCVYSIHHCVLEILLPVKEPFPISCKTCIFLVIWLFVYSQYALKPWPTVLLADNSLIWFIDLKWSCLSKVEHNRRCITDKDAVIRRLPLS